MQKTGKPKKMDDFVEIGDAVKEAVRDDLGVLSEWVDEFGIDRLKLLCSTIAEIAKHQPDSVNGECPRVLDALLPPAASRVMRQLLQGCTPKILRLVKELAPARLSSDLLEIIIGYAPLIVGKAPTPGQSHLWRKLDPTLEVDRDGDCQLNLKFFREDGQSFFVQGSLDTAIGRVLPMIMETLARAEKMGLGEGDVKNFSQAYETLDKQIKKVQGAAKPRGTGSPRKDGRIGR